MFNNSRLLCTHCMSSIYSLFALVKDLVTLPFPRCVSEIILHTSFIDILRSFNDRLRLQGSSGVVQVTILY